MPNPIAATPMTNATAPTPYNKIGISVSLLRYAGALLKAVQIEVTCYSSKEFSPLYRVHGNY
jgi:hypothetical protein